MPNPVPLGYATPVVAAPCPGRPAQAPSSGPVTPAVADRRCLNLEPGRRVRTTVAGLFLFLPLLAPLHFDHLVTQAGDPGSEMIPATSALPSLLALTLLDQERRSHLSDFHCDEGLGLCAGLNVLPKTAPAAESSYRTQRAHQPHLLSGWISALAPLWFPAGRAFSLDFHAIPVRGAPTDLENPDRPRRGKAGPSVPSFCAQEPDSRVVCSANAHPTRADQPGERMRFVAFWHPVAGHDPLWLLCDSPVVPSSERARVNQRGIPFVTIRRRGAAVIRRPRALPPQAWQPAVIDPPKRRPQRVRCVDESLRLPDDERAIRPRAVDGLGREQPTRFPSHNLEETARAWIIREAGRHGVADGLGTGVHFFHRDGWASEARWNVDLEVALTVLAHGCDRWLAPHRKGFDRSAPKRVFRKFVAPAGLVTNDDRQIVVRLDRRSHNPILRETGWDRQCPPIPWLNNLPVTFAYR